MLSLAGSRLALAAQLAFLGVHSIAALLGTIYKYNTPQLYEKNSHGPTGWVITLIVAVQCAMELVKLAVDTDKATGNWGREDSRIQPITAEALERHHRAQSPEMMHEHDRHFADLGGSRSQSVSSTSTYTHETPCSRFTYDAEDAAEFGVREKHSLLGNRTVERAAIGLMTRFSGRAFRIMSHSHNLINRTIFLLGFVAFVTGAAVYGGVFVRLYASFPKPSANAVVSVDMTSLTGLPIPSKAVYSFGTAFSPWEDGWVVSLNTDGHGILDHHEGLSALAKAAYHPPSSLSHLSFSFTGQPMFS